ncbi:hypothetical protein Tco_1367704 [Tanacetum coccineum]
MCPESRSTPPSPIEIPFVPEPEYPEYLDEDEDERRRSTPKLQADSSAIPVVDPVPSAGDTEAFETDESAPTPRAPQIRIPFAQTRLRRARKSVRPEPPMSASMEARIAEHAAAPTPPPLPIGRPMMEIAPTTLEGVDQRVTELDTTIYKRLEEFEHLAIEREAIYARIAWTSSEERSAAIEAHVRTLEAQVATLIAQTTSLQTQLTTALGRIATQRLETQSLRMQPAETRQHPLVMHHFKETRCKQKRDGENSDVQEPAERRQVPTQRECTYTDFLKCQPINFKGTEGVVGLTQWAEKMESVFLISNCAITRSVKIRILYSFKECHDVVELKRRAVDDVAYAMAWTGCLKRMKTDKLIVPRARSKAGI